MNWLVTAIITGITSFAATNIDDIVILTLFYAQADATFRKRHIVAGQYLGFTALIILSLPGFFGGLIVPRVWIGLLGLLPIVIGIKELVSRQDNADAEVQVINSVLEQSSSSQTAVGILASVLNPQTVRVAAVTVANGGDNIGIYVPLFASSNLPSLGVILSVFFLLVGVWCYVAYRLTSLLAVANVLTRYGRDLVPFVLIGLGVFILLDSGTYRLLLPQNQ